MSSILTKGTRDMDFDLPPPSISLPLPQPRPFHPFPALQTKPASQQMSAPPPLHPRTSTSPTNTISSNATSNPILSLQYHPVAVYDAARPLTQTSLTSATVPSPRTLLGRLLRQDDHVHRSRRPSTDSLFLPLIHHLLQTHHHLCYRQLRF